MHLFSILTEKISAGIRFLTPRGQSHDRFKTTQQEDAATHFNLGRQCGLQTIYQFRPVVYFVVCKTCV